MRHFNPETEHVECYDVTRNMIWWQPLTAWTDWFVTRNGENTRRACGVLFELSHWTESVNVNFIIFSYEIWFCFYEFDNKTELLINKFLQVECHLKQSK